MKCPICSCDKIKLNFSCDKCMFHNIIFHRHKCLSCGLIFGPDYMINMSKNDIIKSYVNLYKKYSESTDITYEMNAFNQLNPITGRNYINYGSGNSLSINMVNKLGYNCIGYDPVFCNTNINNIQFDGLFSSNVLEHFQNPCDEFNTMCNISKNQAHFCICWAYDNGLNLKPMQYANNSYHLMFYTKDSIKHLANLLNFTVNFNNFNDGCIISFK